VFERDVELLVDSYLDQNTYGNDVEMSIGTIVVQDQSAIATSFELTQNYPNPFNPSTMIEYNIETAGHVNLQIYDIMGRLVRTLVNEYQEAGYSNGYKLLLH
jgi:flagellar hook assembly protein FlgD